LDDPEDEIPSEAVPAVLFMVGVFFLAVDLPFPYMDSVSYLALVLGIIMPVILPFIVFSMKSIFKMFIINIIVDLSLYSVELAPLWALVAFGVTSTLSIIVKILMKKDLDRKSRQKPTTKRSNINKKGKKRASKRTRLPRIIHELRDFVPEPVTNEEDLEKQMTQYLRAKGYKVDRQVRLGKGLRADLRVGNCIIEIKIAYNRDALQRLIGQVEN